MGRGKNIIAEAEKIISINHRKKFPKHSEKRYHPGTRSPQNARERRPEEKIFRSKLQLEH